MARPGSARHGKAVYGAAGENDQEMFNRMSGIEEGLDKLVEICGKFGVEYVDDFRGEWAPKNA